MPCSGMSETSPRIVASSVNYWHPSDERAFFEWLDRMPFVREYRGVVSDLFIELNRKPTYDDLWKIVGFCRRYGVDLSQLEQFVDDENRMWLPDEIGWSPSLTEGS